LTYSDQIWYDTEMHSVWGLFCCIIADMYSN